MYKNMLMSPCLCFSALREFAVLVNGVPYLLGLSHLTQPFKSKPKTTGVNTMEALPSGTNLH